MTDFFILAVQSDGTECEGKPNRIQNQHLPQKNKRYSCGHSFEASLQAYTVFLETL